MNWIRDFGAANNLDPVVRIIDNDAPGPMRQELVDAFYLVCEQDVRLNGDRDLYFVVSQSLGVEAAANPTGGRRQRIGRDIGAADWPRVFDLIVRLWPIFQRQGLHEVYRAAVNRILAAYAVVWDLGEDGQLHRVLPAAGQQLVVEAIAELRAPAFAAAQELFRLASNAYDARPRNDRDACTNAFDALESVAKVRHNMPAATFGAVLAHIRRENLLDEHVTTILESLNTLRNRRFGHGMVVPFTLVPSEVDFIYLSFIGAIVLFCRR